MNDRELLLLAAKAASYQVSEDKAVWGYNDLKGEDILLEYLSVDGERWNPLEDDGDALRLAVRCDINIFTGQANCAAQYWVRPEMVEEDSVTEYVSDSPDSAVRRAIVRAAAEIGKSMG